LHEWLADARIKLEGLERPQMEQWLLALNDRGLHPSTRQSMLLKVRCYLRWLYERDELKRHPDDLIRSNDLPKLPSYLPRPLAPKADVELQKRLEEAGGRLHRGLLLMRHTGLRIGELMALELDCVRVDSNDNRFLKVPLGKLNNERLVPVAEKTYQLIRSLQATGWRPRQYLVENARGERPTYGQLREALREVSDGLEDDKPITSHRLRHTYATTLLNGGMSLVGVMKLLGHRDYRMTLRYTAITQELVGREYFEALSRLEGKYGTTAISAPGEQLDPIKALTDIVAWTQNNIGHDRGEKRIAQSLTKRLLRIQDALQAFIGPHQPV
jgi:site-specific recombinase XerD